MRRAKIILVAALVIPLAGCVWGGKPKAVPPTTTVPTPATPAPPPPPLSIPQTQAKLPPYQPLDEGALATATAEEKPAPVAPRVTPPAPPRNRPAPQPKPVDPPPQIETARPPIQEILPADVQRQFQESARRHKAEVRSLLEQSLGRRLTPAERGVVSTINQIVKQSDQAEKSGDMRAADNLAERAHILAKELQSGK